MIIDNMFNRVLIDPALTKQADTLNIITGYSSPSMVSHHFENIKKKQLRVQLNLIIGMTPFDGVTFRDHMAYKQMMEGFFLNDFFCSYVKEMPAVHSKVYIWLKKNKPICAYIGSANFTQSAFIKPSQMEVLGEVASNAALSYFTEIQNRTIYCTHEEADSLAFKNEHYDTPTSETELTHLIAGLEHINVPLTDRSNRVADRSGLNWGQRPEIGREPNQAYIPLKVEVCRSDFFPKVGYHFTVQTDDMKYLICSRAQQNGKAIHTPHNNSLIGEYFRYRLGIPSGKKVTLDDLESYGRNYVTFYKIDDENYYMDFSAQ